MLYQPQTPAAHIVGIDEAGRGPLAGPVVAAAVVLDPAKPILGLADSKKLSAKKRSELFGLIKERSLAWHIAEVSAAKIDQINILQATLLAMSEAVAGLDIEPALALVDGNKAPQVAMPVETIVKGDQKEPAISAASILAKVARDTILADYDKLWPEYGFAQHKGYPTAQHVKALQQYGPIAEHRRSYKPVQLALAAFAAT